MGHHLATPGCLLRLGATSPRGRQNPPSSEETRTQGSEADPPDDQPLAHPPPPVRDESSTSWPGARPRTPVVYAGYARALDPNPASLPQLDSRRSALNF